MLRSLGICFLACVAIVTSLRLPLAVEDGLPFVDCGGVFEVTELHISECSELPCNVIIGTNLNVTVKFKAGHSINIRQNDVIYEVEGINVNAEVSSQCSPRGCKIPPGEYLYENSAKADCTLPEGVMSLLWKLIDDNNKNIFCFKTFPFYFVKDEKNC